MSCLEVETLVAFVEGRLDARGRGCLEAHVATCADCGERLSLALAGSRASAGHAIPDASAGLLPPVLSRGTVVGRYVVLGMIGRGAMGEVYSAYDPELDRKVALKVFGADRGPIDDGRQARLLREARAIAKVRHPGVVMVHDAGTSGGRVFLAMEYVEGVTLGSWLSERPRSQPDIVGVFSAAGRGLAAAHAAGLVHRDFKPSNVMVSVDGSARVLDFGLVQSVGGGSDARAPSMAGPPLEATGPGGGAHTLGAVGTPLYMAPEQFLGRATDARTDQFSFCVALHEALYGKRPFAGSDFVSLMAGVCAGKVEPAPPRTKVSVRLRGVVVRGLRTDPAERWPSMDGLLAALAPRAARRRTAFAATAALAALAVAGWFWGGLARSPARLCQGAPERWSGIWELPGPVGTSTPRRTALREAFASSGIPGALDAWAGVAAGLDAYVGAWQSMYTEACQATHVRGEQSVEVLDLRMSCLTETLVRVHGITEVLSHPNSTLVANALTTVDSLPLLDRCADLAMLKATVRPPEERTTRARVAELSREVARVESLSRAGQCAEMIAAWRALCAESRRLGYGPLLARSLVAFASSGSSCLDPREALEAELEAIHAGLAAGDDETAAEAMIDHAGGLANAGAPLSARAEWLDLADASLQRLPHRPPVVETWRLNELSVLLGERGDPRGAEETFRRAIDLIGRTRGFDHLDYAIALNNRATVLHADGRDAEALELYQRSLQTYRKAAGPQSSHVALALANTSEALVGLGRFAEACVVADDALAVVRQSGSASYLRAVALTIKGEALLAVDQPSKAIAAWEQALTWFGNLQIPYRWQAAFDLARALVSSKETRDETRDRALSLARAARDGYHATSKEGARVDLWLQSVDRSRPSSSTRRSHAAGRPRPPWLRPPPQATSAASSTGI